MTITYRPDNELMPPEAVCEIALRIATTTAEDVLLQYKGLEFVVHAKPLQFVLNLYHEHRSRRDKAAAARAVPIVEEPLT